MTAALPPLYDRWLSVALGESPQAESRATCFECAMAPTDTAAAEHERVFISKAKCCTYYPLLSNFNLGRILAAGSAEATQHIQGRIDAGAGVGPLGIAMPGIYRALYGESLKAGTFGRFREMRCPYYVDVDGGRCGVHQHREAICSTWFCKFERGTRGYVYWALVKDLLQKIERAVRIHCITTLDLGATALQVALTTDHFSRPLDEHDFKHARNEVTYRRNWGRWLGREKELYVACADIADKLEWPEVATLVGAEGVALANVISTVRRQWEQLPRRVSVSSSALVQLSPRPGMARLRNRGVSYDYVDVPLGPLQAVGRLQSGALDGALAALRAEGVPVDEDMVRTLLDYQVLMPVDEPPDGS